MTRSILSVASLILAACAIALFAPQPSASAAPGKNLKVYPPDTDTVQIKKDMKLVSKALGVQCDFCHDLDDFSKDDNKHKEVARQMMRMTASINGKLKKDGFKAEVSCMTCHNGAEHPKK